ncbi:hypothetical protein HHK36_013441 [Tetracentron sinense]|uniref:Uncharacterized protein n=1 Tax=Tetracentron sinense TaxID=13715 RepID=A0A834Z439_TETSI|nr:hypothetical protein HHK36_013441 [Tetracentron sinense]
MATNVVSRNVHDHGSAVDGQKKRVKCKYCFKVMSGFNRLKCHLGGVRGDVVPCEEVPTAVKVLMRDSLLESKRGSLSKEVGELHHPDLPWKRIWCPNSTSLKHHKLEATQPTVSRRGKHVVDSMLDEDVTERVLYPFTMPDYHTVVKSEDGKEEMSRNAQRCIGRFFYETGIDFSAAKSPSFQRMIDAAMCWGQVKYKIPSCEELKGWILQEEMKEMHQYVKEVRHSWGSTGCSILLDGWTDEKGRSLINFLVDCPQGPIFLRSSYISASTGDVDALQLSAMPFLTLENIVSEEEYLKNMFLSYAWTSSIWASRTEGKRLADLVGEPSFWSGARMALKATIPLVRVLCLINGGDNKPQLGYIYETMDQAKETIKKEFKDKRSNYLPFWEIIDGIWDNQLHSPLHSAGYFLNPSLFYSSDFFADAEVASGLLCCIVRMVEDRHIQDLISLQLDEYREAKGAFGQQSAIDQRTKIPPDIWWSSYGGHCPELQRFAIRILSQTCTGASRYELKRDLSEQLHKNGRNSIEKQRLNDLTFVHYNLQLQHLLSVADGGNIVLEDIDPMDDWILEEPQEIGCQNDDVAWMDSDCGGINISKGVMNEEGPSNFQLGESR